MDEIIAREDISSAVESYMMSPDFVIDEYVVKPFSESYVGFMGKHYMITVRITFEGITHEISMFAKLAATSTTQQTTVTTSNYFAKEVFAYVQLVPKLNGCLPGKMTLPVPRCLLARDRDVADRDCEPSQKDRRLIVLENMTGKGFRLLEDLIPLDLTYCRAVLKSLARFHSSSLLLQESLAVTNTRAEDAFRSDDLNWMSGMNWALSCARSMTVAVSELWPDRFKGQEDRVLTALNRAWERVYAMAYTSDKYSNVLCHADLWTNNMLFAFGRGPDGENIPTEVVFVDLQFVHYTPPALDILLFLHLCTTRDFRQSHLVELLEFYHQCVREYVPKPVLDKIFPLSSFIESFEEFREYGRLKSTGYLPTVLQGLVPGSQLDSQEPDALQGMLKNRGLQIVRYCKASEAYRIRIEECFRECLEGLDLWA